MAEAIAETVEVAVEVAEAEAIAEIAEVSVAEAQAAVVDKA